MMNQLSHVTMEAKNFLLSVLFSHLHPTAIDLVVPASSPTINPVFKI